MTADLAALREALAEAMAARYPGAAAGVADREDDAGELAALVTRMPAADGARVLERVRPELCGRALLGLADRVARDLLPRIDSARAASALAVLDPEGRARVLARADAATDRELRRVMAYPPGTAGALMDPRVTTVREGAPVREALALLREAKSILHMVYLVDADRRILGAVSIQRLALADPDESALALAERAPAAVPALATREELIDYLSRTGAPQLAVVDVDGALVGVLRHRALLGAVEEEAVVDLQKMVGASADERALSPVRFAVRKRLPWMYVNMVTAFLAASVVNLFESTIALVTSLAVLMPIVAGQSGNSGAQALAVTMRGLVLREIRSAHWYRMALKEILVGTANGVALAAVTSSAVWVWSGSATLAAVIGAAMVFSMAMGGLAGASIPIVLRRLGQDPAQSSSIFLTTITDVVGFSSFLGLATLLADRL